MMERLSLERLKGKITVENIVLAIIFCEALDLIAGLGRTLLNH